MNYVIYGAGFIGLYLCDLLIDNGITPKCILDKDESKWRKKWSGVEILTPSVKPTGEYTVIVAHSSVEIINSIKNYLKELEYENIISVYDFAQQEQNKSIFKTQRLIFRVDMTLLSENESRIEEVSSMFYDDISVKTYGEIILALKDASFANISNLSISGQYMAYDVIRKINDEVFADVGAGPKAETLFSFLENNANFALYYMFEPCESILSVNLPQNVKDKVVLVDNAVWEFGGELRFKNYMNTNALIIDNGERKTTCISLDDFKFKKPPTFLKIDTEGYDQAVLRGASKIINEYRPVVACAVYHNLCDFWEIPLMLKNLPDYKFYLRSYMGVYETIMYAVPKERCL